MGGYDTDFYDLIRPGCQSSAAAVVPLLMSRFHPGTVIDVGCGEGHWGAAFARAGCEVVGVDGDYVDPAHRAVGVTFLPANLSISLDIDGDFDLAICLEVAEHLPPERAQSFVDDLCVLAPRVVFSAAIPGQGGVGHLNEQWPRYGADLFWEAGYVLHDEDLRVAIWSDDDIECWYRQNLLVFDELPLSTAGHPAEGRLYSEPHALVHPILYDARRGA